MTTTRNNRQRSTRLVAATSVVGALMAVTAATTMASASAMPGRDDHPTAPVHGRGHLVGHGCFITPHTWSEALAGPLPRCYTEVP